MPQVLSGLDAAQLVHVLATLFMPLKLPRSQMEYAQRHRDRTGPSLVVLPPLPDAVRQSILQYNRRALTGLLMYTRCFVHAYSDRIGEDVILPFSQTTIAPAEPLDLPKWLQPHRFDVDVTSAFVALSGHEDKAESLAAMCDSMRDGLHLDPHIVPLLELPTRPNNAYLFDFYKHGQKTALLRYNRVKEDTAHDNCKSFALVLKALHAALDA